MKICNKKPCAKNIMLFKEMAAGAIMESRKGRKKNEDLDRDQEKEEVL